MILLSSCRLTWVFEQFRGDNLGKSYFPTVSARLEDSGQKAPPLADYLAIATVERNSVDQRRRPVRKNVHKYIHNDFYGIQYTFTLCVSRSCLSGGLAPFPFLEEIRHGIDAPWVFNPP